MEAVFTNWHVITGGPSSGKSTTLGAIALLGYRTIPEAARVFIDEEISKGKTIQEIRKPELKFQKEVFKRTQEIEDRLDPVELIFLERGILDSIPYMELAGASPKEMNTIIGKRNYKKIFLMEQVPFEKDYARVEDVRKASLISKLLFRIYSDKGYNVINVPLMSVPKRVDFILKIINN